MAHEPVGKPFRGSDCDLTADQLRGPRVRRLHRDVYVLAVPPDDGGPTRVGGEPRAGAGTEDQEHALLVQRCQGAMLVFPEAVICGRTAARVQRLPVDDDSVVHIARGRQAARSRRAGVRVHRLAVPPTDCRTCFGLTVVSGPRLLTDLSAELGLEQLVALGDAVQRRYGRAAVTTAAARHGRRRGAVLLRQALPLLDGGAESPAESRARLRLHQSGFDRLRHQVDVLDPDGRWLARPDLTDRRMRVAVQYDGLVHWSAGPQRWRHDLDQDERLRALGWQVVRATALDDADPALLVAKVAAAYRRAEVLHHRTAQ